MKEAEQIRRSVYNILRQEQREQQPRIWSGNRQGGGISTAACFGLLLRRKIEIVKANATSQFLDNAPQFG